MQPSESVLGIEFIGFGEVMNTVVDIAISAIFRVIAVHHARIFAYRCQYLVAHVRTVWTEVEHKCIFAAAICQHLVVVLFPHLHHRKFFKLLDAAYEVYHIVVECIEEAILQVYAIHEFPLAASVLIRPSIAFAREVNPFGMAEFIAHKVEITAVDSRCGDHSYHLMERHTAVYCRVIVAHHHVPVHCAVDKAEYQGLIAHQCLVVTLGIADGLFVGTTIGEFPEYRCRVPIFVLLFLDGLNPIVGYAHRHAIIEAHTALGKRQCQTRHTAHLFGYGDGFGVKFVNQQVGEGEIHYGIYVLTSVVVVAVAAECLSEAVIVIEHRGHAIEAESVEMIFFNPEFAV